MINDDDIPALLSLLTRFVRVDESRKADKELKVEIDARLATYAGQFKSLKAAFSLYGIDTGVSGWGVPIRDIVGQQAFDDARRKGGRVVGDMDTVPVVPDEPSADQLPPVLGADASVRELVQAILKDNAPDGLKAAEIKALVDPTRSEPLHEKTIGMTLYRLSRDGLAQREGRTWFYVPPKADAKNPGAEDAGAH